MHTKEGAKTLCSGSYLLFNKPIYLLTNHNQVPFVEIENENDQLHECEASQLGQRSRQRSGLSSSDRAVPTGTAGEGRCCRSNHHGGFVEATTAAAMRKGLALRPSALFFGKAIFSVPIGTGTSFEACPQEKLICVPAETVRAVVRRPPLLARISRAPSRSENAGTHFTRLEPPCTAQANHRVKTEHGLDSWNRPFTVSTGTKTALRRESSLNTDHGLLLPKPWEPRTASKYRPKHELGLCEAVFTQGWSL
jgi:hypothetical protein